MFSVIRASQSLMGDVRACINTNYDLYEPIVDPVDLQEHFVDEAWAERNFAIREFYLGRDSDLGRFVDMASYQNLGEFAYIGYFYVQREFQRQGYGRAMMGFLEMRAKYDNLSDLRLFCHPKSTWACEFYTACGFHVLTADKGEIIALNDGVMAPFYEQDSLFLQKELQ
ncbi:MAG TPA: GNAT family N-acetyltransferase [Candidatus Lokiarchaeia archaeon]|nr:GNAT family N-acetyltransferase [Candidatus Lokiarchaeia archaeon]